MRGYALKLLALAALSTVLLTSCTTTPPQASPLTGAAQLVLVIPADWNADHARLQRFERDADGRWQALGEAAEVMIGRSGSAWGIGLHPAQADGPQKHEGDGRAPAGVFAIGEAFGAAPAGIGALPWLQMSATHWCVDVPDSPLYNRIVDSREVGEAAVQGASERMRLDLLDADDTRYREGFVIAHNPAGEPGRGSCIFGHLLGREGQSTAGCTAMSPAAMQALLAWLDPARTPRFVLLPAPEYSRLQHSWNLPAP